MKAVRRKLNSRRGASMLIALLYFLVASVIGAVVLIAASGNAGRITHHRNDLREYYAVQSAVKLVKEDMADEGFSAEYSQTIDYTWVEEYEEDPNEPGKVIVTGGYYDASEPDYSEAAALTADGLLETQLSDFVDNYFSGAVWTEVRNRYTAPATMQYPLSFTAEKDNAPLADVPAVTGSLEVDPDTYDITVTLQTEENGSNPVELYFEAVVRTYSRSSGSEAAGSITATRGITVTWRDAEVTKGE